MTYKIETTDPVSGKPLDQLMDMPYVVESSSDQDLVIYFESTVTRDIYLQNPEDHELEHHKENPAARH